MDREKVNIILQIVAIFFSLCAAISSVFTTGNMSIFHRVVIIGLSLYIASYCIMQLVKASKNK